MEITVPISSLIIIFIGSLGICVSIGTGIFFLFKSKVRSTSTYILSALLVLSGLTLLNETLNTSGLSNRIKDLYFIPIYYALSIGPLFYLFIKSKYQQRLGAWEIIHLILPLVQCLVYFTIGFRSVEYKSELWENPIFRSYTLIESILFPLSIFFYSFLSISILRQPTTNNYFWNIDLQRWLSQLTKVFIGIATVELFLFVGEHVFSNRYPSLLHIIRIIIFVLLVLWVSFNTIKLLFPSLIYSTPPSKAASGNDRSELQELKARLTKLMEVDRIYLNPDLNLSLLANYLDTSVKKCSQLFSSELDTNFNQYVNAFRIAFFKEKILNEEHLRFTIMSLAFECGFESKSTFNRSFKQMEGISPSSYIKAQST